MINLSKYNSLIFDCDGVILNSNNLKTKAFIKILSKFDKNAVNEFIEYHKINGGISRYIKLENFLNNILPKYDKNKPYTKCLLEKLLNDYSKECKHSLCESEVTKDLKKLRIYSGKIPWLIVSGGDQKELREVFKYKKITSYFNGGIFGSPDKKHTIIKREIANGKIKFPALMFGDSKLDYNVAKLNNIDFLFVTQWTDLKNSKTFCEENLIPTVSYVSDII